METISAVLRLIRHKGGEYGWNKISRNNKTKAKDLSTNFKADKKEKTKKKRMNFDKKINPSDTFNEESYNKDNYNYYDASDYYDNSYRSYANKNYYNAKHDSYGNQKKYNTYKLNKEQAGDYIIQEVEITNDEINQKGKSIINSVTDNIYNAKEKKNRSRKGGRFDKKAAAIRIVELKDGQEIILENNIKSRTEKGENAPKENTINNYNPQITIIEKQLNSYESFSKADTIQENSESKISHLQENKHIPESESSLNNNKVVANTSLVATGKENVKESTSIDIDESKYNKINNANKILSDIFSNSQNVSKASITRKQVGEMHINKDNLEKLRSYFEKLKHFSYIVDDNHSQKFSVNNFLNFTKNSTSNISNSNNRSLLAMSAKPELELLSTINQKLNKSLKISEKTDVNNSPSSSLNYTNTLASNLSNNINLENNHKLDSSDKTSQVSSFSEIYNTNAQNNNNSNTNKQNQHLIQIVDNFQISIPAVYTRNEAIIAKEEATANKTYQENPESCLNYNINNITSNVNICNNQSINNKTHENVNGQENQIITKADINENSNSARYGTLSNYNAINNYFNGFNFNFSKSNFNSNPNNKLNTSNNPNSNLSYFFSNNSSNNNNPWSNFDLNQMKNYGISNVVFNQIRNGSLVKYDNANDTNTDIQNNNSNISKIPTADNNPMEINTDSSGNDIFKNEYNNININSNSISNYVNQVNNSKSKLNPGFSYFTSLNNINNPTSFENLNGSSDAFSQQYYGHPATIASNNNYIPPNPSAYSNANYSMYPMNSYMKNQYYYFQPQQQPQQYFYGNFSQYYTPYGYYSYPCEFTEGK